MGLFNRILFFILIATLVAKGQTVSVYLEKGTTLSDLVSQGIDIRHRIPGGRQASFKADKVKFTFPEPIEIELRKGECIITFLPDQTVWYLNYYERTFSDTLELDRQLKLLKLEFEKLPDREVVFELGEGISFRGGDIFHRTIVKRAVGVNDSDGWLHFLYSPKRLGRAEASRFALLDAEILPPFKYPNHDMTPLRYPESRDPTQGPIFHGWRSPAQPGSRGQARDKVEEAEADSPRKDQLYWLIAVMVGLGMIWLLGWLFFEAKAEGVR